MVVAHDRGGVGGPHVLFYGHYDVQPVDPVALWQSPPFEPRIETLAKGRKVIRARGAADDKGQLLTFVEACRAFKSVNGELPVRVSILFEGEEESGSRSLVPFLEGNSAELRADVALVCDTGMWEPRASGDHHDASRPRRRGGDPDGGQPRSPFGHVWRRGAEPDPRARRHSGASSRRATAASRCRVSTTASANVDPEVKAQWAGLGFDAREFLGDVGLKSPAPAKTGRSVLEQIWSRPTAEVNGIVGGYTGEGFKTVIPSKASAKVSFRLVGDQDPVRDSRSFPRLRPRAPSARLYGRVHAPWRQPRDPLPLSGQFLARARKALTEEWGSDAAMIGGGGSIPVVGDFKRVLGMDSLMIGFGLDDDAHPLAEREIRPVEFSRRDQVVGARARGLCRVGEASRGPSSPRYGRGRAVEARTISFTGMTSWRGPPSKRIRAAIRPFSTVDCEIVVRTWRCDGGQVASAYDRRVKPSALQRSLPTPWWTKNRPSGSYLSLTCKEPCVVRPPIGLAPRLVEEVALRHVGADGRQKLPDFVHGALRPLRRRCVAADISGSCPGTPG